VTALRSLLAITLGSATPLAAQADARVELTYPLQQRVRVSAPSLVGERVVGRVAAVDSSHLQLSVTPLGTIVAIPYQAITEVRASRGRDRSRSAKRGALIGVGLGTYFFATTYPEIREGDYFGLGFIAVSLVSFAITPGAGAIVGYAVAPEQWEPRRIPAPLASGPVATNIRLVPDEHIRLRARDATLSGRVAGQTRTVVTIRTSDATVPVPWIDVTRLEVRGGKNRRLGALIGAMAFIGLGVLGEQSAPTESTGERIGAFAGATIVGALLGSRFLAPRGWSPLPRPAPMP
jgi:hypothetical protein